MFVGCGDYSSDSDPFLRLTEFSSFAVSLVDEQKRKRERERKKH